jgi:hypothetical protein
MTLAQVHARVALTIGVVVGFLATTATPVLAQAESFSSYADYDLSSDGGTVYGTISYSDESSCTHGGYQAYVVMTGPNGARVDWGWNYAFGTEVSIPYDGDGDYQITEDGYVDTCSCGGGGHPAGAGGLTWHLGHRTTYYTGLQVATPYCYYADTACSSGTPTCTTGTGYYIGYSDSCPNYSRADWLIGLKGTETRCLVAVGTGASGPGPCS